ncbi:MAG: hypothetical protein IKM43_00285 [Clostridia bacterium]|nr:hypothetical protein [Clostridia bacterium]
MDATHEKIETLSKDIFHAKLLSVYREFDDIENIHLTKTAVLNELNKRKKIEDKIEKINKLPLIGKMIPSFIPGGYCGSSEETKFILSIMNNLGIDYLDNNVIKYIWNNQKEFYEKYYREDYEKETEIRLRNFLSEDVENSI